MIDFRRSFTGVSVIALLLVSFASGCDSTLAAEDYNQACQVATDCVTISVGDICDCSCEGGAINKSDQAKYEADEADARDACMGTKLCKPCGPLPDAVCNAGKCALGAP